MNQPRPTRRDLDRDASILWARDLLGRTDWVILDSETTGLYGPVEFVQLAVLAPSGQVLLDALCRPEAPIPADATEIHGITDAMVRDALPFPYLYMALEKLLLATPRKTVVIYNASYDLMVLLQNCERHKLPSFLFVPKDGPNAWQQDAMERYSAFVGEWNDHFGNYKWQKLGGDHNAIGDCRAVLKLLHLMAEAQTSTERADGVTPPVIGVAETAGEEFVF